MGINVLVMVYMFSHWTKAFPCRQATASSVAKILLEKSTPTWGTPFVFHSDKGTHFTCHILQQVCAVWPVLQNFHCTCHPRPGIEPTGGLWQWKHGVLTTGLTDREFPRSFCLLEHINGIIKTQLAKFIETLQIPWSKVLLLFFLNLRSTHFWNPWILSFEIVTGHPMHLALDSFDPQLIKGEILQYFKGIIACIKNSHAGLPWWHTG